MKAKALRLVAVLGLLLCSTVFLSAAPAQAAPPYGGGDCWRGSTPLTCYQNHAGLNQTAIYFYVNDVFSSQGRPNWHPALIAAMQSWNTANGPQSLSTAARAGAKTIVADATYSSVDTNLAGAYGFTYVHDYTTNTYVTDLNAPVYADRAIVRMNISELPDDSGRLVQAVFAHELGHAMLQGHTNDARDLMYTYICCTSVLGPRDASDIGALPPCSGSLGSTNSNNDRAGTRCIYRWNT